jgi:hypothetical protein
MQLVLVVYDVADDVGLIRVTVTKKLLKSEFAWLPRDIEEGEIWYKCVDVYGCAGPNGIMASQNKESGIPAYEFMKSHIKMEEIKCDLHNCVYCANHTNVLP